jgi:hypothetical protein
MYAIDMSQIPSATVVWNPVVSEGVLSKVVVESIEILGTGTITYFISRDNGTTYTQCIPDTITDISIQPVGTSMVIQAVITGNAELSAIAWGGAGADSSDIDSVTKTYIDTGDMNNAISTAKLAFDIQSQLTAGKLDLVDLVIDTLNDTSGIDTSKSSNYLYDSTVKSIKPSIGIADVTTPTQVVGSAYDISGTGGRKITMLSNGWIVASAYNGTVINFYVSKNNGATFTYLCYLTAAVNNHAICSNGTTVYVLTINTADAQNYFSKFDATTVTDINIYTGFGKMVDTAQTSFGSGCSLVCDPTTGYLYAAWCSKNATYPNSFNLRHAMSTDGGLTWKKVDGTAGIDQWQTACRDAVFRRPG